MIRQEQRWIGFRQSTMPRIIRALLFWTLFLGACSPSRPSPEAFPTTGSPTGTGIFHSPSESPTVDFIPVSTKEFLPPPKLIVTLATPHIDQGPDGLSTVPTSNSQNCGYQWAYQDLPDLSSNLQQSIQAFQPEATAKAFAFGENCVHADGSINFLPMETDFNITMQVRDLSNEADLGGWIVKVMQVIENIPHDQIVGPRPGRVTLVFQSNGEQKGVNFYIDQYHGLPPGLSNAELYQSLQIP